MDRKVNAIAVFDASGQKVLMCRRRKDPYQGLLNFVGGKIEKGESSSQAAYRELFEETGITREDIRLVHFMDFRYYKENLLLEIYYGRLKDEVEVHGEENELLFVDLKENFFDYTRFAGEGNIGHILERIRRYEEQA